MSELKIELIQPFVTGTKETFEGFVGMKIKRKDLYLKQGYGMWGDVSGIIGLSGVTTGNCAISLSRKVALESVGRLLMTDDPESLEDVEVNDGVGELINMIAGRAKAILSTTPYKFDITLPTIITGKGHEFFQKRGSHCVVILFEAEIGECFTLDVSVASR